MWGTLSVMVFPSGQVSKLMFKAVPKTPNTKFKHTEHHSAVPSSQYPKERETSKLIETLINGLNYGLYGDYAKLLYTVSL